MKYFVFSIDDGTIYDKKVIEIFNRYNIKATFNLNSGLDDFVWYLNDQPIERLKLPYCVKLYKGHEIASHSLTHPHLTMCPGDDIVREVGDDILNLERIFDRKITTFAFPFEDFDDRCISIIKHLHNIDTIRLSEVDDSFKLPIDDYHIKITSLDINDALVKFDRFINDEHATLFVFVSHGYDFYVNKTFDKLEELCQKVANNKNIKVITMSEIKTIKAQSK